ncbi:aldo/keto reductase [Halomonas alkalisoli]|uniref:aldo/keto reductase n=1 Tax=Halomonas alkalisoli TaxID=2907158 RepID=UPI001F2A09A5|nr:aldo/keto reductase [Halomonas alkalisoli]MCE9683456.1 aldo/keto reductase [Halomonas alkalisoli]
MQYVNLGRTGLKVSRLCLGCMSYGQAPAYRHAGWTLNEEKSRPFIKRALEGGINFFDTADSYAHGNSEEVLGRAIRDFSHRDEVVIATKVFFPMGTDPNSGGLSRKHIMASIDASLRRLGTDHIDLYQLHRWDYQTPIEETLEAMNDVVRAGKARYIGASSMYTWQFAKALYTAERNGWTSFVSMQPQYNLIYREAEREMLPFCQDQGIGVIPWSPLARGFLAGNRNREGGGETARAKEDPMSQEMYYQPEDFAVAERLAEVARELGQPMIQVALAWVLAKNTINSAIIGATKSHHLEEAFQALELELSEEVIQRLEEPYRPHRILDHQ